MSSSPWRSSRDRVGPGGERQYELITDGADVIELTEPFDIKLPIAEITP
ncbi:hypothetical protein [Micromonospora sp. NPDC005189]